MMVVMEMVTVEGQLTLLPETLQPSWQKVQRILRFWRLMVHVGSMREDCTGALDVEHTCTSSVVSRLVSILIDIREGVRNMFD